MSYAKKITSFLMISCTLNATLHAHPLSFLMICCSSSKVGVYDPATMKQPVVYDFHQDVSNKETISTVGSIQSTPNPSAEDSFHRGL